MAYHPRPDQRQPGESAQEYSERMHRENDPHPEPEPAYGDDEDDYEMQTECPYCGGNGCDPDLLESRSLPCPECGGWGWD